MNLFLILLAVGKYFVEASKNSEPLQNDVCLVCSCNKPIVNCEGSGLDNVLSSYEWPNWTELSVYMDNNVIRYVGEYPGLPLTNLSLAHNLITEFAVGAFKNLTCLRELNLADNYLMSGSLSSEIFKGDYDPEYYWPLKTLTILNLSHNQLEYVDEDLFLHLPFLQYLDLSYNPIGSIDDTTRIALAGIPFLKNLDLSYTGINNLPEYFLHNCAYLKELNLEGNKFTEMPELFMKDKNFTHIQMTGNPIKKIYFQNFLLHSKISKKRL